MFCFVLIGFEVGLDVGSIFDIGVVCKGMYNGEEVIGLKFNWLKCYIIFVFIVIVFGFVFKMYDFDGLLGDKKEFGIICVFIFIDYEGV